MSHAWALGPRQRLNGHFAGDELTIVTTLCTLDSSATHTIVYRMNEQSQPNHNTKTCVHKRAKAYYNKSRVTANVLSFLNFRAKKKTIAQNRLYRVILFTNLNGLCVCDGRRLYMEWRMVWYRMVCWCPLFSVHFLLCSYTNQPLLPIIYHKTCAHNSLLLLFFSSVWLCCAYAFGGQV